MANLGVESRQALLSVVLAVRQHMNANRVSLSFIFCTLVFCWLFFNEDYATFSSISS